MFPNGQSTEERKAEFRKYLEDHGVIDEFKKIFEKIITAKEKPENPIEFVRRELGDEPIPQETFDNMELELEEARREISRLREAIVAKGLGKLLEEQDAKLHGQFPTDSD